jgi:hypothetical protein
MLNENEKKMIKKTISLVSLLLFIITCGLFGLYAYLHHSIVPQYKQKLLTIADNRKQEIGNYLNQQEKNAINLSQETTIINLLSNGNQTIQAHSDKDEQQSLTNLLAPHKANMGFKNILLIDKNGIIRFSTTKKNLIGININDPLYVNSSLEKSYERASMTLTNDFSNFNFNDLLQEPALFITIPILKNKKFLGTLTYQLDQEKIYLITNQYIGLGKTGEVALAKKDGEYAVFLSPTRNDPDLAFKKRILFTDPPLSIQASILGQEGSGLAIDYRGKHVLGAWRFIPKLDWGMIVKIDRNEILFSITMLYQIFLFLLLSFIISLLMNVYFFYPLIRQKLKLINNSSPYNKIPSLLKNPLFIALLIFCGLTIKNIIQSEQQISSTIEKAKNKVKENSSQIVDTIETILEKIAFVGQSIADDLRTHYLVKEDIITRIKRDLTENHIITEITILFAPYTYNKETKFYVQSTNNTHQTENLFKTKWYTQAVEKNHVWITNPIKNEHNIQPTATYARTFFDKKNNLNGVIAITFSLKNIINLAEFSGIGQTGYSIIMNSNGSFIFHPINSLVQTETTLSQYAQSKGNEELAIIAQKIIDGKPHMDSYSSESTNERFWIYTQPIKTNHWIIGSLFSEDEIVLPSETIRHYYFWILIWATIALLLLCALLLVYTIFSLTYYAIMVNIILIFALITTWHIIKQTTTINRESRTIITDQSSLNKFSNDLNDEAERKHEAAPINIPCGILLYSLSIPDTDHITISGYIWNKYNILLHKHIGRGMELPQATKLSFGNPLTSESDNGMETTTWNIQGILFQEQNHILYPFDQQQIRIILEHKDIEKNIILTPDLTAYKKISPESTPGLDKEFSLAGFTIEQTFFEYHKINPSANFGFKEYGKVTDNYQLIYNAIMNRNLLNPFVLYILPLLVILFSLFTTLLLTGKKTDPLTILGAYSGLFFALILLQRSLREQHPAGTTLYMEYAFFYTYITIILLIFHTILMYYYKNWHIYQDKSLYCMRILFWPFQFVSWIITTLIIFY